MLALLGLGAAPLANGGAASLLRAGAAGMLLQIGRAATAPAMGSAMGPAAGGGGAAAGFATAAGETDPSRLRNFAIIGVGVTVHCAAGPAAVQACHGHYLLPAACAASRLPCSPCHLACLRLPSTTPPID